MYQIFISSTSRKRISYNFMPKLTNFSNCIEASKDVVKRFFLNAYWKVSVSKIEIKWLKRNT